MTAAKELAPKVEEFSVLVEVAQRDLLEYTYVNALLRSKKQLFYLHVGQNTLNLLLSIC